MSIVTLHGSYGSLDVDTGTGNVLKYHPEPGESTEYADIARIDLAEWRAWAAENDPNGLEQDALDICEVGFWTTANEYVPASSVWREEFLERQKEVA